MKSDAEITAYLNELDRTYAARAGTIDVYYRCKQDEDRKDIDFPVVHLTRALRDLTEYELFLLKFRDVVHNIVMSDPKFPLWTVQTIKGFYTSIVYGDGRCDQDVRDEPYSTVQRDFWEKLKTIERYRPETLSGHKQYIDDLIIMVENAKIGPVNRWLRKHIGRTSTSILESKIFSEEPGESGLLIGVSRESNEDIFYTGESSLLTIAPPGKGKTQCHVLPTLADYPGPIIVLDVKGECYDATHEQRQKLGQHIIRFAPTEPDPDRSARYNPLAFVDDHPDELWESARFLADLMVIIRSQNEPTWEMQGKDLLTLFIAYTVHSFPKEERTLQKVLDLVSTIGLAEMLEDVAKPGGSYPTAMQRTAAKFRQTSINSPKQFEGVLAGASQHMQVWEGPKIERLTRDCDWEPEDFRREPYPTLYLCIPPEAIDTYAPILRVVIGQHVRRLMRQHERKGRPILFLLDELPRLGQMQPIREALETGRSYGIKLWMFAQYPEQITNAYPGGIGEGMMKNCDVRMYMGPSLDIAEHISKSFGESVTIFSTAPKRILDATEIVSPEHRESIFVLATGEDPLILKKDYYHITYGEGSKEKKRKERQQADEPDSPPEHPSGSDEGPAARSASEEPSAQPRVLTPEHAVLPAAEAVATGSLTKPPAARRAIEGTPLPLRKKPDHPSFKQAVQMYLDMEELNTRPIVRAAPPPPPPPARQAPIAPVRHIARQAAPEPPRSASRFSKWWGLLVAVALLPFLGWGAVALLDETNQRQAAELKRLTEVEKKAKLMFETQDQLNARERKLRDSTAGLELDRAQLEQQKKTLELQRQSLSTGQRTLAAEQEAQDRQRRSMAAERDELNRQRTQLDAERRALQAEWERLSRQQAAPAPTESEWPPARRYGPPPSRYGPPGSR